MTTVIAPRADRQPGSPPLDLAALVVPAGGTALITTDPGKESLVPAEIRFTDDVDEFRAWFAIPGDRFQAGLDEIPPEHLPNRPWRRGSDFVPGELTADELEQLRLAASCYLFGHTPSVSDFREAIERYYAPFGAAFYRAGSIEVQAGASLTVRGYPAVVDLDELVVRQGGQVFVHTPVRLAVRALTNAE